MEFGSFLCDPNYYATLAERTKRTSHIQSAIRYARTDWLSKQSFCYEDQEFVELFSTLSSASLACGFNLNEKIYDQKSWVDWIYLIFLLLMFSVCIEFVCPCEFTSLKVFLWLWWNKCCSFCSEWRLNQYAQRSNASLNHKPKRAFWNHKFRVFSAFFSEFQQNKNFNEKS
jgi:hypothetical protein